MRAVADKCNSPFTIKKARIFDGESVIAADTVLVEDGRIAGVGQALEQGGQSETIDAPWLHRVPGAMCRAEPITRMRSYCRMDSTMHARGSLHLVG